MPVAGRRRGKQQIIPAVGQPALPLQRTDLSGGQHNAARFCAVIWRRQSPQLNAQRAAEIAAVTVAGNAINADQRPPVADPQADVTAQTQPADIL